MCNTLKKFAEKLTLGIAHVAVRAPGRDDAILRSGEDTAVPDPSRVRKLQRGASIQARR